MINAKKYSKRLINLFDGNKENAAKCVNEILTAQVPYMVAGETILGGQEAWRIFFEQVLEEIKSPR